MAPTMNEVKKLPPSCQTMNHDDSAHDGTTDETAKL